MSDNVNIEQLKRWRLILGQGVNDKLNDMANGQELLDSELSLMDQALAAIYDDTNGDISDSRSHSGGRSASLGASSPRLANWLGDIRSFFPSDIVSVIQGDAIERKGLTQLLFEPETLRQIKPDIRMVATLIALKGRIPEQTKETARLLVREVVDEIMAKLAHEIRRSVTGSLNRRKHSPLPSLTGMDWKKRFIKI